MLSPDPIDAREAQIQKFSESKKNIAAIRQHLKEIIEGPAFKGSHRSAQFLAYIVEQSVAGNFDQLKERLIGVELFGRDPSYDTGEDAIVRVTASDVRKRLLQHYGRNGVTSEFRFTLPLGSYIPEITQEGLREATPRNVASAHPRTEAPPVETTGARADPLPAQEHADLAADPAVAAPDALRHTWLEKRAWLVVALVLVALNLGLWWGFHSLTSSSQVKVARAILPWSALFNSSRITHLITSDPNIVVIQEIAGTELSVSDYANHKFIPEPNQLTADQIRFCQTVLWGDDSAAAVDPPITASIAALAQAHERTIDVRAARNIQLADLKTDDNFIFLGSPRSDPWSALFSDQLDFRFAFDETTKQEIIRNVHPRPRELPEYVPTANGWATGQSFAIIAFVQNLDQSGQVLLLAGANGEGTEAAGKLATTPPRFSEALRGCGIYSGTALRHFEMLLRLSTMAGSPTNADVLACHILPGAATH
jgi:hypothetical protein